MPNATWAFGLLLVCAAALMAKGSPRRNMTFHSTSAEGACEFTHIGGRTEVFKVERAEITCIGGDLYDTSSTWQLNAWPAAKGYASVTLTGRIDPGFGAGQLVEYHEPDRPSLMNDVRSHRSERGNQGEFHSADIALHGRRPASVLYRHMRFDQGRWVEAARYEATFQTPQ